MSRRTDALAIHCEVKAKVAERDSCDGWPCCRWCGKPAPTNKPLDYSCAHYIARAQGGLGIEENILTLCPACHSRFDNSASRAEMRPILRRYLREHYEEWSEEKLIYRRDR